MKYVYTLDSAYSKQYQNDTRTVKTERTVSKDGIIHLELSHDGLSFLEVLNKKLTCQELIDIVYDNKFTHYKIFSNMSVCVNPIQTFTRKEALQELIKENSEIASDICWYLLCNNVFPEELHITAYNFMKTRKYSTSQSKNSLFEMSLRISRKFDEGKCNIDLLILHWIQKCLQVRKYALRFHKFPFTNETFVFDTLSDTLQGIKYTSNKLYIDLIEKNSCVSKKHNFLIKLIKMKCIEFEIITFFDTKIYNSTIKTDYVPVAHGTVNCKYNKYDIIKLKLNDIYNYSNENYTDFRVDLIPLLKSVAKNVLDQNNANNPLDNHKLNGIFKVGWPGIYWLKKFVESEKLLDTEMNIKIIKHLIHLEENWKLFGKNNSEVN